jgi:hypothetical protein
MQLALLQQQFMAFLRDESQDVSSAIIDSGKITRNRRLEIYHHAYRARLVEVMRDVFERTWAYLGDAQFDACATQFIEKHPPAQRTLNRFGDTFPDWLATQFPDDMEIAEVAIIDWQLRVAFDGANATPLTLADLSAITGDAWATVGFDFHPTLAVTPITHNAASIWEALEHGASPPEPVALTAPTWLVVWRREFRPHFVTVDAIEAAAIAMIQSRVSFAETCSALNEQFSRDTNLDIVAIIGAALRRWIDDEMLVGVVGRQ